MCGFAGFVGRAPTPDLTSPGAIATRMAAVLSHRGPNDAGTWEDAAAGYAVGFRRLSIIDLTPHGHQPMQSDDGRFVLVFNGEIYNHADVRAELGSTRPYHGNSDTEVMLRAFERWGPVGAVRRFVGMFAFALWDRRERVLTLGRDRVGEKPLYYARFGDSFLFGSELKALRAHPDFRDEIDRDALAEFMGRGYIPAPHSIYRGVFKLPPGTLLSVSTDPLSAAKPAVYWCAREAMTAGDADPWTGSPEELADQLDDLLRRAVRAQMVADVPLGAFLSGGVDSSTVVGLMQAQSGRPVKTFTIGFSEAGYDEAGYAREVARHLGTDHTELYVSSADALAVVPRLPEIFDEPFADSSQIPTYLVSRLAAQQVTVSLSGDGGDELFGGYSWYRRSTRLWRRLRWAPPVARRVMASAMTGIPVRGWDGAFRPLRAVVSSRVGRELTGDKAHKLADLIGHATSLESVCEGLKCLRWGRRESVVVGVPERRGPRPSDPAMESTARLMLRDLEGYLPDDILAKVDRTTMAASLESRAPLLDHRVVEFASRVPLDLKIRDGRGKWLLRRVLDRYVPRHLVDRAKMGFCVPIDHWLRGPLRGWANDLLADGPMRRAGFLNPDPIRRRLVEHQSGRRNWALPLWRALMFQSWLTSRQ